MTLREIKTYWLRSPLNHKTSWRRKYKTYTCQSRRSNYL